MSRIGRRAFLATVAGAGSAGALGRIPASGVLRLRLPLYFGGLDPHVLDDPLSALFCAAFSDALFALDASGRPYPTLASSLPEQSARGTRVRLRPELNSARGRMLRGRDVAFSLKRAQSLGGAAVLGAFKPAIHDDQDELSVIVADANPDALARSLASPLTAIVPRGFSPRTPDGTGAFKAELGTDTLTLIRNENAARGAAFLERIEVTRAADLADALRSFEVGQADVGWLGNGLYRPRAGALPFEGPGFGWFVLRTGLDAKAWGAPGVAQQLAAGVPSALLARFGVRPPSGTTVAVRWAFGPSQILVADDAPHALELARAVAPILSSPGNELRATPISRVAWLEARRTRRFSLLLDFVRRANDDESQSRQALLAAVDPALAKRPPKNSASIEETTRTLSLGVIGEAHALGARDPRFEGLESWQLGDVWCNPEKG